MTFATVHVMFHNWQATSAPLPRAHLTCTTCRLGRHFVARTAYRFEKVQSHKTRSQHFPRLAMRSAVEDLVMKVTLMRDSLDLPTEVVLENGAAEVLPVACKTASQRCTALVIGLQNPNCSEEVAVGGCRVVETAFLDVLSVLQVVLRDRADEMTLVKQVKLRATRVFDALLQLLRLLPNKEEAAAVSPGTGLVWSVLAELGAVQLSSNAQLKRVLDNAESAVMDTIEEMTHLPTLEEDESEGLSAKELTRAARAVMALKAARGVFKFCGKSLGSREEQSGKAMEELIGATERVSRAVEDVGCCLYAPQDVDELVPALQELTGAVIALCEALVRIDRSPEAAKMRGVAAMLCKDAIDKIANNAK